MNSYQIAITRKNKKREFHRRLWSTWEVPAVPPTGIFKRWGKVSDLHASDTLLLDFDWHLRFAMGPAPVPPSPPVFSLAHTCGFHVKWQKWTRTRRGWHLVVKLSRHLLDGEIIAAQAILGSDAARERLNLARAISIRLRPSKFWHRRISLLFERKVKK